MLVLTKCSKTPPTKFLELALDTLLHSHLRRWALLLRALTFPLSHDTPSPPFDLSLPAICAFLHIEPPSRACVSLESSIHAQVREWIDDRGSPGTVSLAGLFEPATPCSFIRLPDLYQDIVIQIADERCPRCDKVPRLSSSSFLYDGIALLQVPHIPAVCLVCGTLVCINEKCCTQSGIAEGAQHARTCGAGMTLLQAPSLFPKPVSH